MDPRTISLLLVGALPFLAISPLACSSSSQGPSSTPAEAGADGGVADTGSPLGDGSDGGGVVTANTLLLTASVFPSTSNLLFYAVQASPRDRCAVSKVGTCFAQDCRAPDGGGAIAGVTAGEIDLNRGSTTLLKINPDGPGALYTPAASTTAPWAAGDALHFVAAGGEVPAFDIPLTAPAPVVLTSPTAPDAGPLALSLGGDLVIHWTPAGSGGVTVGLNQVGSSGDIQSQYRVLCEFSGAAGAGTVPASLMARFSAGAGQTNTFYVGGNATADVTPGGYALHAALLNAVTAEPFTIQ